MSIAYDDLNRATGRTYSGLVTPPVTYCYDGNTAATGRAGAPTAPAAAYSIGRLTMTCNANSATSILNYDPLGRVLQSRQTPAGGQPYPFTYAYNVAGGMTSEQYPSMRMVTTGYDTAGRPNGMQNQTAGTAYTSGVGYAANNAVNSLTLGNGVAESTTFNTRFQPTQIAAGSLMTLPSATGPATTTGTCRRRRSPGPAGRSVSFSCTMR